MTVIIDSDLNNIRRTIGAAGNFSITFGLGDQDDNLILFPLQNTSGEIDAGALSEVSNGEAVSEGSLSENSSTIGMNLTELREIAKTDNMLKTIKNLYINYESSTGTSWNVGFVYWWGVGSGQVLNTFSNPANYTFDGYQPRFKTGDAALSFDGVYHPPKL